MPDKSPKVIKNMWADSREEKMASDGDPRAVCTIDERNLSLDVDGI